MFCKLLFFLAYVFVSNLDARHCPLVERFSAPELRKNIPQNLFPPPVSEFVNAIVWLSKMKPSIFFKISQELSPLVHQSISANYFPCLFLIDFSDSPGFSWQSLPMSPFFFNFPHKCLIFVFHPSAHFFDLHFLRRIWPHGNGQRVMRYPLQSNPRQIYESVVFASQSVWCVSNQTIWSNKFSWT